MKKRVMDRVLERRRSAFTAAEAAIEKIRTEAFSFADVSDAQKLYSRTVANNFMSGGDGESAEVDAAKKLYLYALKKHGFNEHSFEYSPRCALCGDTGVRNGKICNCVWSEYLSELKKECGLDNKARFTFADFESGAIDNPVQRKELSQVYTTMSKYADKYPDINVNNIVLTGQTGTGKTCLASAVALKAVSRGYSALLLSAYEFNTAMLTCHTSPISERKAALSDILECDFLIIDDLGTEPMLKNVTLEYLLVVLEERLLKNRATIITTNLSLDRISSIYGERIYSRLSDKRRSLCIALHGEDLRRK